MAWTGDFLDALARPTREPVFVLESLEVAGSPMGGAITIASHSGYGDVKALGLRGVSVQGQRLSSSSWTTSIGAWSVEIVGDITVVTDFITRGTIVRLLMGFAGWRLADFQPVAIGQVRNVRGRPPKWTVEVFDFFSCLRGRMISAVGQSGLFANIATTTTLTVGYGVGDTALGVNSTAGFAVESGGATGALLVSSSGSSPFYLTWSSATATVFTLSNAGVDQFGTPRVIGLTGSTVAECAYLNGHPLNVLRKMLTSSGTANANGTYDKYPSDWGFNIPFWLIDHEDMDAWRDGVVTVTSGSHNWDLVVTEEWEDAYSELTSLLSNAGLFFAVRQGKLTVRAAQDPLLPTIYADPCAVIEDRDIVEVIDWEAFDAEWAEEHKKVYVSCVEGSAGTVVTTQDSETTATLPSTLTPRELMMAAVYENTSAIRTNVLSRVKYHHLRVPERVRLELASLVWASMCVGDAVLLHIERTFAFRTSPTGTDNGEWIGIVVEVSPDWIKGTTRVAINVYPSQTSAFVT